MVKDLPCEDGLHAATWQVTEDAMIPDYED